MSDARKRFRFSLITLIVAVNVAGVLVWANLERTYVEPVVAVPFSSRPPPTSFSFMTKLGRLQGWPLVIRRLRPTVITISSVPGTIQGTDSSQPIWRWSWISIASNLAVAILILSAFCAITEFLVRRIRKAKRHDG